MAYRVLLSGVAVALLLIGYGDTSNTSNTDGSDDSTRAPAADASAVNCGGSV